jgi:hypothetical protein
MEVLHQLQACYIIEVAMTEMILLKTTVLIIKMVNGISVRMQIFVTMKGVYQVQVKSVLRKDHPALKTTLDMVITVQSIE